MKTFFRKYGIRIFFGIIIIMAIIGYTNYFANKLFGIGCAPDPFPDADVVVVDDWTDTLISSGYEPAVVVEETTIPDELPESVAGVIHAEGEYEGAEVILTIVETPDGNIWVKETIDGNEVKFDKIEYVPLDKDTDPTRWTALIQCAYVSGSTDWGVGGAYTLCREVPLIRSSFDLFAVADLNPTITDAPDWYAGGCRLAWHRGSFSVGVSAGYGVMEAEGFFTGVDFGVAIGL